MRALPVDIRVGTVAAPEMILAEKEEHAIVATGALREAPDMPGKDLDHVFDSDCLGSVLFSGDANATRGLPLYKQVMVASARKIAVAL